MVVCVAPVRDGGICATSETVTPLVLGFPVCHVLDHSPFCRLMRARGGSPLLNETTTEPSVMGSPQSSTIVATTATGQPADTTRPPPSCVNTGDSFVG